MLNFQASLIVSPHLSLYHQLIPKAYHLRQMNDLIDFSFVQKEWVSKYCLDNGRMTIDPIQLFKSIHVINPSTLTKFRKLGLKDGQLLDLLISKTVETPEPIGVAQPKTNWVAERLAKGQDFLVQTERDLDVTFDEYKDILIHITCPTGHGSIDTAVVKYVVASHRVNDSSQLPAALQAYGHIWIRREDTCLNWKGNTTKQRCLQISSKRGRSNRSSPSVTNHTAKGRGSASCLTRTREQARRSAQR